jgi:hypothetical protein
MKRVSVLVAGIVLMGIVAGCSNNIQSSKENVKDTKYKVTQVNDQVKNLNQDKKIVATVINTGDMIKSYDTLEKLTNGAEIVVQGNVLETNSYVQGPGVVTEYKFKVSDSFYGEFEEGSIINLISAGGIVPYTEAERKLNIPKKDFEKGPTESEKKNGYLKYVFNGSPLIEKEKNYIIFAKKEPVSENKELYAALGIYQGQFDLNNTEVSQYNPDVKSKAKKWEKGKFISEVKEKVKLKK